MMVSNALYSVENDVEAAKIARDIVENAKEITSPAMARNYEFEKKADIIEGYLVMATNALDYFVSGKSSLQKSDVRQCCSNLMKGLDMLLNVE